MRSKYGAVRTNGYASGGEARRAEELKLLERAGKISNLREQVRFTIIPKQDGFSACTYVADFCYLEDGVEITEDFKGCVTPIFEIKRKLMKLVHGIDIRISGWKPIDRHSKIKSGEKMASCPKPCAKNV